MMRVLVFLVALVASAAALANQPCSGRRGGVAYCSGSEFVCVDGGKSKSVKNCQAYGYASVPSSVVSKKVSRKKAAR